MAGAFTAVDLSQLPFPDAVETINFEAIVQDMLADLRQRDPSFSALVESDPSYKILEVAAFREGLIRQRVNEAIKAITLAYAAKADLEQIAARYNVERLVVSPADDTTVPPTPAVMEDDESLRRRVQLSFEGFSTAGPRGAYVFHALGASGRAIDVNADAPRFERVTGIAPAVLAELPADAIVLTCSYDAGLINPLPGDVAVVVQSIEGDGTADQELLTAVETVLANEDVRPLTDNPRTRSAQIITYTIAATIKFYNGPDATVVMEYARAAVTAYAASQHRLGLDVTRSGIFAALHQAGVQNVILAAPAADIVVPWDNAAFCTSIELTDGGSDE